jgi:phage-related protein
MAGRPREVKRRWRQYRSAAGKEPVKEFIAGLSDADAASIVAAMKEVRDRGSGAARHLDGDIWEVRADSDRVIYRILFAEEGKRSRILLALEGFQKKTQKTPPGKIAIAKRRLRDWRGHGE